MPDKQPTGNVNATPGKTGFPTWIIAIAVFGATLCLLYFANR